MTAPVDRLRETLTTDRADFEARIANEAAALTEEPATGTVADWLPP